MPHAYFEVHICPSRLLLQCPTVPPLATVSSLPPQVNPALLRAEEELTDEDLVQGERRAKELMHDRRRAQLDVYLICAAYRKHKPPSSAVGDVSSSEGDWNLHEEDTQVLDRLLREAAAIDSPV